MAATTQHIAHRGTLLATPAALLASIADRIAVHSNYRRTFNALSKLSNRELADLGLHRSMLKSAAYEAARNAR